MNDPLALWLCLGGLVAFAAPIVLYITYFSGKQVVYEGAAICRSYTKTVFTQNRPYALVFVVVPGQGEILAEISHARAQSLSVMEEPVTVRVVKRPLKAAQIESISFADAPAEPAAPSYDGLGVSLYFLTLAAVALMWPSHLGDGTLAQHVALLYSALCFAAAGFFVNVLSAKDEQYELKQARARFLFIPLGSGYAGLYTMWILCTAVTVLCFWQVSLLILLPGLHAAFAAGAIPGVLWRNKS